MKIKISAYENLIHNKIDEIHVPENCNVAKLIEILNIENSKIGIILVNGSRVTEEFVLSDGDNIKFLAPILGG